MENNLEFLNMQRKLVAQIEQQKKDEELARRLQLQYESDNKGGNSLGVSTRKTPMKPSSAFLPSTSRSASKQTKGRQMTLEEMLNFRAKRKRDESE